MRCIIFVLLSIFSFQTLAIEKSVSYQTFDGYSVEGRIAVPDRLTGQVPGVLLIHGSGALDFDMWLPGQVTADGQPTRMFKAISDHLIQNGFAVMRFSKRGVTQNPLGAPQVDSQVFSTATVSNLKEDVKSALEILRADPRVDPSQIILLGISEGTILGPMVANEDGNIAGLVMMSSVGQSMRDIIYFQLIERHLMTVSRHVDKNHDGLISEEEISKFPELSLPIKIMDKDGDGMASMAELKSVLLSQYYAQLDVMLSGPNKEWFKEHFESSANFKNLVKYKGPTLYLHGEVDAQTPLSDVLLIFDQLKASGHSDFELKIYPGLGHGFSPHVGTEGVVPTVGPIKSNVLLDMSSWLAQKFLN